MEQNTFFSFNISTMKNFKKENKSDRY